jgi:signal peptidase I
MDINERNEDNPLPEEPSSDPVDGAPQAAAGVPEPLIEGAPQAADVPSADNTQTIVEPATAPSGETEGGAPRRRKSRIREDIEAVILAIIFVVVIRQYVAEAYKIPTGSMEPTLMGDSEPGRGDGDNIIVDKMYYWYNPVARWDVVVFKRPNEEADSRGGAADGRERAVLDTRNFIKRCIGLPGETIQIKHGDVYITNNAGLDGEIPQKPAEAQEALWQRVYFCDFTAAYPFSGGKQRWDITNMARISFRGGKMVADAGPTSGVLLELQQILDYRIGDNNEEIEKDKGAYGKNCVGDIMIETSATFGDADSSLTLEIVEDDCLYTASLGPGGSAISWRLGDAQAVKEKVNFDFSAGVEYKIRFINVDDRLRLMVNGKPAWGEHHFAKGEVPISDGGSTAAAARIRILNGKMTLSSLNIYRDVYYTDAPGNNATKGPYHVPEECYFALGDNSPISSDSRVWGTFSRQDLIGKACFVFFPFHPVFDIEKKRLEWKSRMKLIR